MPFLTCLQINNQIIHFPSYPIPSVAPGLTDNHTRGSVSAETLPQPVYLRGGLLRFHAEII